MFYRFARATLFALSALTACQALAVDNDLDELRSTGRAADEWRVIKQDRAHSITAYDKRDVGNNLRSFKVEYDVDGDLNTLARIYFDFSNYTKWFYQAEEARLLRKVSATEFYYYIVHRAPPTLPDRDAIIHVTIQPYSAKRGYSLLTLVSVPDYLPRKSPYVRMVHEDMTVKWTPIGRNKVHGVVEGYVDPGGVVPSWAINYVQRQAPYLTALAFQRMVKFVENSDSKAEPAFPIME